MQSSKIQIARQAYNETWVNAPYTNVPMVEYIIRKELTTPEYPDPWVVLFRAHEEKFKKFCETNDFQHKDLQQPERFQIVATYHQKVTKAARLISAFDSIQ
jgi:hypothetical protein